MQFQREDKQYTWKREASPLNLPILGAETMLLDDSMGRAESTEDDRGPSLPEMDSASSISFTR